MTPAEPRDVNDRWLDVDEIRLVSDLRIMHSKVSDLYQAMQSIRSRHQETSVLMYADQPLLSEEIAKVDEIYLWYVKLKDELRGKRV
jgi:hypothetical protein